MDEIDKKEIQEIKTSVEGLTYNLESLNHLESKHKELMTILYTLDKAKVGMEIKDLDYSINKFIRDCRMCNESEQVQAKAEFGWAKREILGVINTILEIRFKDE